MKPIPMFEDYSATENGDIYRTRYFDESNKARRTTPYKLTPRRDKDGYLQVNLSVDGKIHYLRVHRLIAMTFIPNENALPLVNHKDGNKSNNTVSNLEWVSHKGNVIHAFKTHLHNGCRTSVVLTKGNHRKDFASTSEAANYLGHSRDCFRRHLTADSRHGEIDGWAFELIGGKERRVVVSV